MVTKDDVPATATSGEEYCVNRLKSRKKLLAPGGAMLGLLSREVPMMSEDPEFQVADLHLVGSPSKFVFGTLCPELEKKPK